MRKLRHRATVVFAAGCLGGMANSLAVWLFGILGITGVLGVSIAPDLTPAWLYPRIVWGGLWGFLFLLALRRASLLWQAVLFSFGPTLVELLVVLPLKADKGVMGLELGSLTPVFVIFFNLIWGLTAATWIRYVSGRIPGGLG